MKTYPVVAVLHARDDKLAEGPWPVVGEAETWAEAVTLVVDRLGCQDTWPAPSTRPVLIPYVGWAWAVGVYESEAV